MSSDCRLNSIKNMSKCVAEVSAYVAYMQCLRYLAVVPRRQNLPANEKVVIILGFTEFRLAPSSICEHLPDYVLGNFHGKYRTSTQTRSAGS